MQCGQRSGSLIDERRVASWIGSLARESICERIPHEASKMESSAGCLGDGFAKASSNCWGVRFAKGGDTAAWS